MWLFAIRTKLMMGYSCVTNNNKPQVIDTKTGKTVAYDKAGIRPLLRLRF